RDAVAPGPVEPPFGRRERAEQELGEARRRVPPSALRERRQHQPVPRRDRLVVAERLGTPRADREQTLARGVVELSAEDESSVLEVLEQRLGRALAWRP